MAAGKVSDWQENDVLWKCWFAMGGKIDVYWKIKVIHHELMEERVRGETQLNGD